MKYIVYIITRDDNKKYVGTTNIDRIKKRMDAHKIDKRFVNHNFTYKIAFETDNINESYEMEEYFIKIYDTFYNGLNKSLNGRGWNKSKKFTTLGYKFSAESRKKMSLSRKKGIKEGRIIVSRPHTEETKKRLSKIRKGKQWGPTKLSLEQVMEIRSLYNKNDNIPGVGVTQRNGVKMSYIQAFCKKYSPVYNVSVQTIKSIVLGKTWPDGIKSWKTN
jgi:predicted GIY-YIG superfamily endonuclease